MISLDMAETSRRATGWLDGLEAEGTLKEAIGRNQTQSDTVRRNQTQSSAVVPVNRGALAPSGGQTVELSTTGNCALS